MKIQRRIGELLVATREQRNKGGQPMQGQKSTPRPNRGVEQTIAEVGLTYDESSDAQALAALPEKDLDILMDKQEAETGKITKKPNPAGIFTNFPGWVGSIAEPKL